MTVPAVIFPIRCNQQLLFLGVPHVILLKVLLLKNSSTIDQICMDNLEDCRSLTSSQNPTPEASSSDALCNYPTLPVILAMDSVARVSMLKRHIKLAETTDALSKNDCVWLFALCAAVDAPLDADKLASRQIRT